MWREGTSGQANQTLAMTLQCTNSLMEDLAEEIIVCLQDLLAPEEEELSPEDMELAVADLFARVNIILASSVLEVNDTEEQDPDATLLYDDATPAVVPRLSRGGVVLGRPFRAPRHVYEHPLEGNTWKKRKIWSKEDLLLGSKPLGNSQNGTHPL